MSYTRNKETQRRLAKVGKGAGRHYLVGVYFDDTKNRWIRYYLGDKKYKKQVHRKMRHQHIDEDMLFEDQGTYHKHYDYWWIII